MALSKHSLTIAGHPTSVSMEDEFWAAFKELAARRHLSINAMAQDIDDRRHPDTNLCSAIRLEILKDLKASVEQAAD